MYWILQVIITLDSGIAVWHSACLRTGQPRDRSSNPGSIYNCFHFMASIPILWPTWLLSLGRESDNSKQWQILRKRGSLYTLPRTLSRHSALIVTHRSNVRFYHLPWHFSPHQRCLHIAVVLGLEWLCDLESYAGGSLTTGRVTHAGKVKR
jgi:hypothetical protein